MVETKPRVLYNHTTHVHVLVSSGCIESCTKQFSTWYIQIVDSKVLQLQLLRLVVVYGYL